MIAVVIATIAWFGVASQAQQPVFRATSELVAVPVSVTAGNTPVSDLSAADFELRDNGIVQTVELVADASAPVDLTIVVDISGSVGPEIELFREDVERFGDLLREGDRIRVLTFDLSVREAVPWSVANELPPTISITSGGGTALNDAVAVGLMAGTVPGRRHVLVVLIDGPENSSAVDTSRVVDLAARANVALFTYELDRAVRRQGTPRMQPRAPGTVASPRVLGRLPSLVFDPVVVSRPVEERRLALERAAERTGGLPRDYKHSALSSLRSLMEEFRHSYVLFFRPSGPTDDAWHDLDVSVTKSGGERYDVSARPGYWPASGDRALAPATFRHLLQNSIGVKAPAQPAAVPAGRAVTADMLAALLDRYERGDHAAVVEDIAHAPNVDTTLGLLRREGRRWFENGPPGSSSRRRTVAAALALDVGAGIFTALGHSTREDSTRREDEQRRLIFWGADLLGENVSVSDAERPWYLAAIAALQGQRRFHPQMRNNREAVRVLTQAIARVPDEARYRWADALVLEQRFLLGPLMSGPLTKPEDVRKAYDAAIARADDDLRAEIELHLVSRFVTANFANEALGPIVDEARREGARTALARTAVAERLTGDPFLVYVCRFFRARIHDRLNERPEAEAAYRSALEVYPGAHSASLPLAALLFLRGEETTARLLVNNALAASGTEDPGRAYFLQDYWRLPKYIEQMRAALGRGGR
jgi:VWFA-related protein